MAWLQSLHQTSDRVPHWSPQPQPCLYKVVHTGRTFLGWWTCLEAPNHEFNWTWEDASTFSKLTSFLHQSNHLFIMLSQPNSYDTSREHRSGWAPRRYRGTSSRAALTLIPCLSSSHGFEEVQHIGHEVDPSFIITVWILELVSWCLAFSVVLSVGWVASSVVLSLGYICFFGLFVVLSVGGLCIQKKFQFTHSLQRP